MLASAYNEHPESALINSKCLTPAQTQELFAAGALFQTVVLPDDSGEDVAHAISGRYLSAGGEEMPRLERFDASGELDETIRRIHEMVTKSPASNAFFNAGGG